MAYPVSHLHRIHHHAGWPISLDPAHRSLNKKITKLFWDIISIIIFPIALIRIIGAWLRDRALRVIVPGKIDADPPSTLWELAKATCRLLYNAENFKVNLDKQGYDFLSKFSGHPLTLTTPDKAVLQGAYFPGQIKNKAIIFAFGNRQQWENHPHLFEQLKPLNTSMLMINPRGVGKSKGHRSEEGYAIDIYAAYDFLINKEKIDPEDIVLVGFSMGGAYGTCGAALVQEQYPSKKINAININSFSSLQLTVQTLLKGRGVLGLIGRISARILRLNLNPKEAWDKLRGKKCIFYNPGDEIIPKSASLYRAVKNNPVGKTLAIRLDPENSNHKRCLKENKFEHNRRFKEDELEVLHNTILDMLDIDLWETDLNRSRSLFRSPARTFKAKTITKAA